MGGGVLIGTEHVVGCLAPGRDEQLELADVDGSGVRDLPGRHDAVAARAVGLRTADDDALRRHPAARAGHLDGEQQQLDGHSATCPRVPGRQLLARTFGGRSPTDTWFRCTHGAYLYLGNDTWDVNTVLDVISVLSIWGSNAIDVYAVGSDVNDAGFVWHYY